MELNAEAEVVLDVGKSPAQARDVIPAIADPGDGAAIPVTGSAICTFAIGAAAETNTLDIPGFVGQVLHLNVGSAGGGGRTVTVAQAFDKAGNTTIPLVAAGDSITLFGVKIGSNLRWRKMASDGLWTGSGGEFFADRFFANRYFPPRYI